MEEKSLDEISLNELLGILLKHKVLLLGTVAIGLLLSLVYAFIIAEPVYQAKAEVEVLDIATGVSSFDKSNSAKIIIDEYIKLLEESSLAEKVSSRLKSEGVIVDKSVLDNVISVAKSKDGVTLSISSRYKDKAVVAPITNAQVVALGEEASVYIKEHIQKQMTVYDDQIKLEKSSYEEALSKYKEYTSTPDSLSKLQSEIGINEAILVQLRANLLSGGIGQGKSRQQLEKDINLIEEKINILQDKLVDATYLDRSLKRELNSSLANYESLSDAKDKLKLSSDYYRDNPNINIISFAVEPNRAISPNRRIIVVGSMVISICIGILVAFTFEYFKSIKK